MLCNLACATRLVQMALAVLAVRTVVDALLTASFNRGRHLRLFPHTRPVYLHFYFRLLALLFRKVPGRIDDDHARLHPRYFYRQLGPEAFQSRSARSYPGGKWELIRVVRQ